MILVTELMNFFTVPNLMKSKALPLFHHSQACLKSHFPASGSIRIAAECGSPLS